MHKIKKIKALPTIGPLKQLSYFIPTKTKICKLFLHENHLSYTQLQSRL